MDPFTDDHVAELLQGGIGIIPTDTLYGIVGRAELPKTVERIYTVRRRSEHKACIVLVSSYEDMEKFGVVIPTLVRETLHARTLWPGAVSVIFPSSDPEFSYLSRDTGGIAFRMPAVPALRDLIENVGPIIAPSANFEGEPTATTIKEAQRRFGELVDFYVDGGKLETLPSTLIKFEDENIVILRHGSVKIL